MPDFHHDEFGRRRNGKTNLKAESASQRGHYSRRENDHSSKRSDTRYENEPHYGPASHEQVDKNLCPGLVVRGEVMRIEPYGAFISFRDRLERHHKGLVHISQLASHRVESVTDVIKMNQICHAVILEVEYDQRIGKRIRLSLKDVDQQTGKYTGPDLVNNNTNRVRGGRRYSPHELMVRAKTRRETLLSVDRHWRGVENNPASSQSGVEKMKNTDDRSSFYLRKLWSDSPSRPSKQDDLPQKERDDHKNSSSDDSSRSSSSSAESSGSSSSESSESEYRRRRKGSRGRRERNSRKRSYSRRQKRPSKSRRRRRRSPSSSSSSSSSSSNSSTSSSSNESGKREEKKIKLDDGISRDKTDTNDIQNLNDFDLKEAQAFKNAVQGSNADGDDEEEEGPMPLQQSGTNADGVADSNASYGKALLPGEGQALAQYVQQNLRIPRRGEIGYSGDDIDQWENSGYVMSGSRHTRMNAVRIRKENQVYSAEEQRALALLTMEENQQKEAQLMEDFRTMLKEKKKLRDQRK